MTPDAADTTLFTTLFVPQAPVDTTREVTSSGDSTYACTEIGLSTIDGIRISMTFDYNKGHVYILSTGPSGQYHGVGFGSTTMENTYAIITNSDGTVEERKLGIYLIHTYTYITF